MLLLPPLPQEKEGGEVFLGYQYAAPQGLENKKHFLKSRRVDMLVETSITTPLFFLESMEDR